MDVYYSELHETWREPSVTRVVGPQVFGSVLESMELLRTRTDGAGKRRT